MKYHKETVVFFDVGNTLIHTTKPVSVVYSDFASKYEPVNPEDVEKSLKNVWHILVKEKVSNGSLRYGIDNQGAKIWWKTFVSRVFKESQYKSDVSLFFDDLYDYFGTAQPFELYEGSLEVVDKLRDIGVRTGIISNWDVRLSGILREMDIDKHFDDIFISCDVGYEKPDERIFKHALTTIGVQPENAVHMGDSFKEDVMGALKSGITPIFVKRNKEFTYSDENTLNVYEISSLKESVELINEILKLSLL